MTGAAATLGNTTNKVSASWKDARKRRYRRQGAAAQLLEGWRVSWCMKRQALGKNGVQVWCDHQAHKAHYRGLATCGSVWTCPVCASKITEKRRVELHDAVGRKGYTPVLVTVTLQHTPDDKLITLIEELNNALKRLKSGRAWGEFKARYNLAAYVSSLEVTYGAAGWHPHKHWLLFLDLSEDQIDAAAIKAELTARYKAVLSKHGRYASDLYGIDVRIGGQGAGEYVSKWGLDAEVTKSTVKEGRDGGLSPFQLLDLYAEGDKRAGALFAEYAQATEGKRQLVWSKGGRKVLGLGEEVEDEDAAAQDEDEETAQLLVELTPFQWSQVLRRNARCRVLEVAEDGIVQLMEFLDSIGAAVQVEGVAYG